MFFSRNVPDACKEDICSTLQFSEAEEGSHYLGLPSFVGGKKTAMLGYLKEKLLERVNCWDGKMLSKGGKEILLKTVAQSIPNYAMSIFLLPLYMCREMERAMCKFWWRQSSKKNKGIHWMAWERMC